MTSGSEHSEARRRRRPRGHARGDDGGPLVEVASLDEVVAAIEAVDLEAPWDDLRHRLRPVLPRRRPLPSGLADLPRCEYPPGIPVGLGLDIGPALLFVGREQLDRWGVDAPSAFALAEANVRGAIRAVRAADLVREPIGGVETVAFQSRDGWASLLLLFPDQLCRVLGHRSGLLLAPMRDLIMWMPMGTDTAFATWVLEELAGLDMNALDVPLLALVDGQIAVADGSRAPRAARHRPH